MKKIHDIQKKKFKHVDIKTDETSEEHIEIHRSKKSNDTEKTLATPATDIIDDNKDQHNENTLPKEELAIKTPHKDRKPIRTIFMGTGHFAEYIVNQITREDRYEIIQIVTQPDKKVGRKKSSIHRTLAPNPVREFAVQNNIELFQLQKFDDDTLQRITKLKPDVIIVAAYGRILPKKMLSIPKFGAINVHASLLPQLRGASPAQNALLLGLNETGVTIMQMDEGLDTGDIFAQKNVIIEDHERADDLLEKLAISSADLLIETVPKIIEKEITPIPQEKTKATLCQMIDREDGHIQWTQTTEEIYNRFRALYPWPGIFSYWEEKENQMMRIKWRAVIPYQEKLTDEEIELLPGTVFIGHDQLCIKTLDGAIIIEALQPECKVVMPVYDFLNGHKNFKGCVLR
jgi:methionyl-tRNA formyltransferase